MLDPNYYFYRLCLCNIGYDGSGRTCFPCMEGGVCHDQMLPTQSMIIEEGYWPSSLHKNVIRLVRCSQALGTSRHVNTSCKSSYFEIIFLLRRMLIAFALSLINRASSFQTIAVCFMLAVVLQAVKRLLPKLPTGKHSRDLGSFDSSFLFHERKVRSSEP